MRQVGHTDPKVTLSIYAQVMYRGEGERKRLKIVSEGTDWALAAIFSCQSRGAVDSRCRRIAFACRGFSRWARLVSNQRPLACEASAFTFRGLHLVPFSSL